MPKNDTKNTKTTASRASRTGRQATLPPQPRRSSPPPARRTRTAQRQEPAATRASSSELAQLKADYEAKLAAATTDLQRMRADFENYQKRVASEKRRVKEQAETATILKLLPVVDVIERAAGHVPKELQTSALGKGLAGVEKNLAKALKSLDIERIAAAPGTPFDPALHDAVQINEDATGNTEVIELELQAGYQRAGTRASSIFARKLLLPCLITESRVRAPKHPLRLSRGGVLYLSKPLERWHSGWVGK